MMRMAISERLATRSFFGTVERCGMIGGACSTESPPRCQCRNLLLYRSHVQIARSGALRDGIAIGHLLDAAAEIDGCADREIDWGPGPEIGGRLHRVSHVERLVPAGESDREIVRAADV